MNSARKAIMSSTTKKSVEMRSKREAAKILSHFLKKIVVLFFGYLKLFNV